MIHEMDGFAGAIGVSDSDGKCTPVYSILTAKGDANPVYHSYVFREMAKRKWIAALSKGIRQRSTGFVMQLLQSNYYLCQVSWNRMKLVCFLSV